MSLSARQADHPERSRASVVTEFGGPEVLRWLDVDTPTPAPSQILIGVRAAGVGPTDLKIRHGDLQQVFPFHGAAVLGFEAAGTVVAVGSAVDGVAAGDEVAAWLPGLGGYAQFAVASAWTPKPAAVSWTDAAALPASAEAAVGVLRQLGIRSSETLLIMGAAGSVGFIAAQLAVAMGVTVLAAVAERDFALLRGLGTVPVRYGDALVQEVREHTPRVDAVMDAGGHGGLPDAIELAGGTGRVITLADQHAAALGVRLSAPTPDRAPDGVDQAMSRLADGTLQLREQRVMAIEQAAEAHRLLEAGSVHEKIVLTVD